MSITRNGDWGVQDYTPLMALRPRTQNLLEELGLFSEANTVYGQTTVAEFERNTLTESDIAARARGADRNYAGRENGRKEFFPIPFFPLDGSVKPSDVQDLRAIAEGDGNVPETTQNRVNKLVDHIQRSHAKLIRKAQYHAITANSTYSPTLTSGQANYSTKWGAARKEVLAAAFDLADQTVDPLETLEKEGRKHIIANAGDDADGYDIIFLCGSDTFTGIITHSKVEGAYQAYASVQEPLRQRLNGNRNNRIFRNAKGFTIIEDVSLEIDQDKGYMMPMGMEEMWGMQFAPADTTEHANTTAEAAYMFMEEKFRSTTIMSESSFVVLNSRPELVVAFTATLV
jgi:hypothetical protein